MYIISSVQFILLLYITTYLLPGQFEASRGAGGTKCDCRCDWLWVRSPSEDFFFNVYFYSFALWCRGKTRAISPEFGGKWGTMCLNLTLGSPLCLHCCERDTA